MEKANCTFLFGRLQAFGRLALLVVGVLSYAHTANAQCNVGCNDDINVTLNASCSAPVTADMVLEGYECLNMENADFTISIVDEDESDPDLNGKGQKIYEISLSAAGAAKVAAEGSTHPLDGWPGCWGYITGEDKTPPTISCPTATSLDLVCTDINGILGVAPDGVDVIGATGADNCGDPAVTFEDTVEDFGDCGDGYGVTQTITRTWTATDGEGMTATCSQTIDIRRPDLDEVDKPTKEVHVECGFEDALLAADGDLTVDDLLDADGHPTPLALDLLSDGDGFPTITTEFGTHDLDDSYCNIGASYEDISEIDVCANTIKIVRQWTIIDWCYVPGQDELNNDPLINHRQIIKYGDFTAPEITASPSDAVVSTGPFDCTAPYTVPGVTVADACGSPTSVSATVVKTTSVEGVDRYGNGTGTYSDVDEEIEGAGVGSSLDLELGATYTITYTATDDCGNVSGSVSYTVSAEDTIEPVAVCDDDLHISVGGDGIGRTTSKDVDEGSWDNCGKPDTWISREVTSVVDAYLEQVEGLSFADLEASDLADMDNSSGAVIWVIIGTDTRILRQKGDALYSQWDDEEWFMCEDVNSRVTIELLARDAAWNTNVCWNDVLIEDKIAPSCHAPAHVVMDCTDLPYGFDPNNDAQLSDMFGDATGEDNCTATAEQISKTVDWECNSGTITRTFLATDEQGLTSLNECTQTITVNRVHNYEMAFPGDPAAVECVDNDGGEFGEDIYGCDLLSVNVTSERFEASGDACYKIKRTYSIINWCEYDGDDPAVSIDREGGDALWVLRNEDGSANVDDDDNPADAPLYVIPADDVTGYWTYVQYIKVVDNTAPEIALADYEVFCSYNNETCDAPVTFNFTVSDVCSEPDIDEVTATVLPDGDASSPISLSVSGDFPDYTVDVTRLPIGNHVLEIRVLDGCRNSALLTADFVVADCKAPTPICINGLAIELMPTEDGGGMMAVWVSDFVVSGLEDCVGEDNITLSINKVGEDIDASSDGITLTCDDPDTVAVEIYAWDNAYNPLAVQPDGSVGGPNYDHCVTYVVVQDNMFDLCDDPGQIGVAGLITNEENETVENVQVNLTGTTTLNTTTSVNGSFDFSGLTPGNDYTITPQKDDDYLNGVSTFDLVLITKHILGSKRLDGPYKLIAADANNSGSISAVDLIQFRKLILSVNRTLTNNSSWRFIPASYQFPDPSNPWAAQFPEILNYNDLQTAVATGDFVAIKLGDVNSNARANSALNDERSIAGVFNLNVTDQEVIAGNEYRVSVTAADLDVQGYQFTMNLNGLDLVDIEYGVAKAENFGVVEEGVITTSWNGTASSSDLFTLVVRATTTGQLSDLMSVNSRYTQAEAYNTAEELMDVELTFNGQSVAADFELYQNTPNPFQGQTMISFNLPAATQATVKIHDVTGKTLKMIRGEYAKGFNQINLNSSELPSAGVLYYTLETNEFTATKKMIVIGE